MLRYLLNVGERAGWTFLQVLLAALMLAEAFDLVGLEVAVVAAVPAGLAVVKAGISDWLIQRPARSFLGDLLERTGFTFAEGFLGALLLASVYDLTVMKAAALGALPAVFAAIKATIARRMGEAGTAATLPAAVTPGYSPRHGTGNY